MRPGSIVALFALAGLPACITDLLGSEPGEPGAEGEAPDGTGPMPEQAVPQLADCSGAGDCVAPAIAAGGTSRLSVKDAVVTSGPFEWLGDGVVRATGAGVGTLAGDLFQIPVAARPIAAVRLGPLFTRAPRFGFVLDSETIFPEDLPGIAAPLALHVSDPHGVVRLWSTEYDRPYGAARLVDTSLRISEGPANVTLTSWDVIEVPPVAGVYQVVLAADSFGTFALEIPVVDHLDRLDAEVWQAPHAVGDTGIVCFHAYTDSLEVAIDVTLTFEGDGEGAGGAGRNCIYVKATGPGPIVVTARAGERTATVDLAIR